MSCKGYVAIASALWLGGIGIAAWTLGRGVIEEPVELRLSDGTLIHGALYRPCTSAKHLPAALLIHGTGMGHRSLAPGLAVPLARHGYLVLAIDSQGQGRSGGSIPRPELDHLTAKPAIAAAHPEVDTALEYIRKHPLFAGQSSGAGPLPVALVGHSRGGWDATSVGYRRPEIAAVVCIGAAPLKCDTLRPRNLLLLTSRNDRLCSLADGSDALAEATGGALRIVNVPFGDFRAGTARYLSWVPLAGHLSELSAPGITKHVAEWLDRALDVEPAGGPAGEWVVATLGGVLAATVGGLCLSACCLLKLARRLFPAAPVHGPDGRPGHLLVFWGFLTALIPVAAVAAANIEVGPAYRAGPLVALLTLIGMSCVAAATLGRQREIAPTPPPMVWQATLLGFCALLLALVSLGIPWNLTWMDLVPTSRRLMLGLTLAPLLFPGAFLLAWGMGRMTRRPDATPTTVLRVLAWSSLAAVIWGTNHFLVVRAEPLFIIPVQLLAASLVFSIPLWVLPDRPGMCLARALAHSGVLAWLLACHLPFVRSV